MRGRAWTRIAALSAALLVMGARHPMHTAVAELTHAAGAPATAIRIRVFADDFGTVAPGTPGTPATDSVMSRYVRAGFRLADSSGRPIALQWAGAQREGDVILLALQAPTPAGLKGARVFSGLLSERFADQINIVRVTDNSRTTTLLFTPGDAPKVLP